MDISPVIEKINNNEAISIAILGNSISQGYYANNNYLIPSQTDSPLLLSWANQLRALLLSKNANSKVYNFAKSGNTVISQAVYLSDIPILSPKPDIVLVALQVNDSYQIEKSVYDVLIRNMVENILDNGMIPVLIKENGYLVDTANKIAFTYEQDKIASEYKLPVIDFFSPTRNTNGVYLYDSGHPNQLGHDFLFSICKDFFEDYTFPVKLSNGDRIRACKNVTISNEIRLKCGENTIGIDIADNYNNAGSYIKIKTPSGIKSIKQL